MHKFKSLYTVSIVIDWFVELSDNKLSDNNLVSELVENRSFLNQSQLRKL